MVTRTESYHRHYDQPAAPPTVTPSLTSDSTVTHSSHSSPRSATSSRQHAHSSRVSSRHAASKSGSSTSQLQQSSGEFPICRDGDVEIVIKPRDSSQEHRYLLNRCFLALHSRFFRESTNCNALGDSSEASDAGQAITVNGSNYQHGSSISANTEERRTGRGSSGRMFRRRRTKSNPENLSSNQATPGSSSENPRWRFELDWEHCGKELPVLVQRRIIPSPAQKRPSVSDGSKPRPPNTATKPKAPHNSFFRTVARFKPFQGLRSSSSDLTKTAVMSTHTVQREKKLDPTLLHYDNLFRAFYDYPLRLNSHDMDIAYHECKELMNLAHMYDARDIVGRRVDYHLLQFKKQLYWHISEHPHRYLRLGYLAKSKVIFSEAIKHLVGQPHEVNKPDRLNILPREVVELLEDKTIELKYDVLLVENELHSLRLDSSTGCTSMDILAETLFHRWLVCNLNPEQTEDEDSSSSSSQSKHGRFVSRVLSDQKLATASKTFRRIGASNPDHYLTGKEVKLFLKRFMANKRQQAGPHYSEDSLRQLEQGIAQLKRQAREVVRPLTVSYLERDAELCDRDIRWEYLTCIRIDDDDFPWQ